MFFYLQINVFNIYAHRCDKFSTVKATVNTTCELLGDINRGS